MKHAVRIFTLLAVLVYAGIGVWDYEANLISHHGDDSPIVMARAMEGGFKGDDFYGLKAALKLRTRGSLVNIVPVWLKEAFGWEVRSVLPWMAVGTILFLAAGLYRLGWVVLQDTVGACLCTLLGLIFCPWTMGLANYHALIHHTLTCYPATVAAAPVCFLIASMAEGRVRSAWVLLAGLFHPAIGLYASLATGLYLFYDGKKAWKDVALLGVFTVLFILPNFAGMEAVKVAPRWEALAGYLKNQHFGAFLHEGWIKEALAVLGFCALGLVLHSVSSERLRVERALLMAVVVFSACHLIGIFGQVPLYLRVTGLRAFCLLAIWGLIGLVRLIQTGDTGILAWCAALVCVTTGLLEGLYCAPLLGIMFLLMNGFYWGSRSVAWRRNSIVVVAALVLILSGLKEYNRTHDFWHQNTRQMAEWVRENTPRDALFLTTIDGWRVMTDRPCTSIYSEERYGYLAHWLIWQKRKLLLRWYGITPEMAENFRGSRIRSTQRGMLNYRATGPAIASLMRILGAEYLAIESWGRYGDPLELVFENDNWRIYRRQD